MVRVPFPHNDLQKAFAAYDLWYKAGEEADSYRSIVSQDKFSMFLGDPRGPHRARQDDDRLINIYNPEVMKKIDLILGPNGYALLKMWKAQMPEAAACTYETYSTAFVRLGRYHDNHEDECLKELYRKFLICAWVDDDHNTVNVPGDLLEWVRILNGPHWETMLKAFMIRGQVGST